MTNHLTGKAGPYQSIFFDMDGTLIESGPGIMNAVRYMFDKIGIDEKDNARIQAFIGPPIIHRMMDEYGFSETDARSAYVYYSEYYNERGILESGLYPGIDGVLAALADAGKTLYVATSKPEYQALCMLKRTGIIGRFTRIFGGVHAEGVYTKDEVLTRAAALLGETPPQSVMVGDRMHDVQGGRLVGMDTIGVLYGYGSRSELKDAGADMIAERPSDLLQLLTEEAI